MVEVDIAVSPDAVAEVELLFELKSAGMFPADAVGYDVASGAFLVNLDAEAARFLLEHLRLALDVRGSLSYVEWQARNQDQLRLPLNVETDPERPIEWAP